MSTGPLAGRDATPFQERLLGHARTLVTLAVLVAILVVGAGWGFHQALRPYPSLLGGTGAGCVERPVSPGDSITPVDVTVSVINGGTRDGLAARTIADLTTDGFARGQLANAPGNAKVNAVEIWTKDPRNPAVRLVRTYLGKRVVIKRADAGAPGVDVVVGDRFTGVVKGRDVVVAHATSTICGP